ncbi:MAG: hypothetical protein R2726_04430 [Acidimicrobiales bacterium]
MSEPTAAARTLSRRGRCRVAAVAALGLLATAPLPACSRAEPAVAPATTTTTQPLAKQAQDLNDAAKAAEELEGTLGVGLSGCVQTSLAYASLMTEPLSMMSGQASREDVERFKKDTAELQAAIPVEIKPQFETISQAFSGYAETFSSIDFTDPDAFTDPATAERLQQANDRLSSPEVKQAQAEVDAYFARICPSVGTGTTTVPSPSP